MTMNLLSLSKQNRWQKIGILLIMFSLITCFLSACQFNQIKVNQSRVVKSILSDPKTFNAVLSQESPNIFSLTYQGLTKVNAITGDIEPALAKSWQFSDDKLTITFQLRTNLKWSDGKPLTAEDVAFSYNQLYLNEEIPSNARDSLRVGQSPTLPIVEKIDDLQIRFTITEPFAPF